MTVICGLLGSKGICYSPNKSKIKFLRFYSSFVTLLTLLECFHGMQSFPNSKFQTKKSLKIPQFSLRFLIPLQILSPISVHPNSIKSVCGIQRNRLTRVE